MPIGNLNVAQYKALAANASGNVKNSQGAMLGFLCTVSGSLSAYDDAANGTTVPMVSALPVVAGTWVPMPLCFANGLNVVLSGGAAGTVAYV